MKLIADKTNSEAMRILYSDRTGFADQRPITDDSHHKWMATLARDSAAEQYLLWEDEGTLVGGAGLEAISRLHSCARVVRVAILPQFRARGFGRILMSLLHDVWFGTGGHKLWLDVLAGNDPALRLYKRCGYRVAGIWRAHFRIAGEWRDSIIMERFARGTDSGNAD